MSTPTPADADLLARALSYLEPMEDKGPYGEGWKSDDLVDLIARIEERIAEASGLNREAPAEADYTWFSGRKL